MNIAINAILLQNDNTGVENYIHCLLHEYNNMGKNWSVFINESLVNQFHSQFKNIKIVPVHLLKECRPIRILYEHLLLPFNFSHYDILHAPGYIGPIILNKPIVLTIHDLITFTHPKFCSNANYYYYHYFLPLSIRKANRIIVPSQYVYSKVLEIFNIPSSKIVIIPEGVRSIFSRNIESENKKLVIQRFQLPEEFLLFVGTIEPKKNINLILDVFEKLSETYHQLGLVLVGKIGWKSKRLLKRIDDLKRCCRIVMTGYVNSEDLAIIYNLAQLFIFPSFVEGFGIPPLEAMASGIPVVVSNCGAISEVIGSAGIALDANDKLGFYQSIKKVLDQKAYRQELVEKGLERIKLFSWKRTAEKTLEVYNRVLES